MSRPLVSVITPTLNQGAFIERTIDSIRTQTYPHIEHIVIDGGSTDGTIDILRAAEGTYPMRWISEPDSGMYAAINKGLRLANGSIHAYLNSDDLYFPWSVAVAVAHLAGHGDVGLVYGDVITVDDETRREHVRLAPSINRDRLQSMWSLLQPATFWRREVTATVGGFDETLTFVGDWDFFIRASDRVRFDRIDEFLAIDRRHGASKTVEQPRRWVLRRRR